MNKYKLKVQFYIIRSPASIQRLRSTRDDKALQSSAHATDIISAARLVNGGCGGQSVQLLD